MESYVLDTNLFFNMEPGLNMGSHTQEVVENMTKVMKAEKQKGSSQFVMPPRILEEFLSFFENKEQPFLQDFTAQLVVRSPNTANISFPADVFYQIVGDIRDRHYRGLAAVEEEMKKLASQMMGKEQLPKKEFEMAMQPVIKNVRKRFRQATRVGFLDSLADLDLIVLAKELNGTLVSTDEGVIAWGRKFGVTEMPASVFVKRFDLE